MACILSDLRQCVSPISLKYQIKRNEGEKKLDEYDDIYMNKSISIELNIVISYGVTSDVLEKSKSNLSIDRSNEDIPSSNH